MQQIQVGKEKTRFKMDRNALTEQRRQTVIGLLKGMNIKKSSEGGFDKDDVYECMQQKGYRLGGEQSGHIIFSKYATTGDGLLTAIKIMEVLLESKTTLSRLVFPLDLPPAAEECPCDR